MEAVADAYMVISGAPDVVATHAERMANTALGMLLASQEVTSPYDYGDKDKRVKVLLIINLPLDWLSGM